MGCVKELNRKVQLEDGQWFLGFMPCGAQKKWPLPQPVRRYLDILNFRIFI